MAFSNSNEAGAAPPMVSFGGDTVGAHTAFKWNNSLSPAAPTDQNYSGVANSDGKGGYLAVPGLPVQVYATIATGNQITAGNLYQINGAGKVTTTAGTAFRALQSQTNSSGGTLDYLLWFEVWKPKG